MDGVLVLQKIMQFISCYAIFFVIVFQHQKMHLGGSLKGKEARSNFGLSSKSKYFIETPDPEVRSLCIYSSKWREIGTSGIEDILIKLWKFFLTVSIKYLNLHGTVQV